MAIDRVGMPEQEGIVRAQNFREVNLGLTYQLAMLEAERCLQCPKPYCVDGCPVRVNIPRFIKFLREGDLPSAAESLLDDNALPCVTGRVCPQETQCEGVCLRGKKGNPVAIGHLERYVADWANQHPDGMTHRAGPAKTGRKVGIVGSGPAGLTAAGELSKKGHDVTVFEAFHAPGGVLVYGIPEFRLPKDIVQAEVDRLVADGVKIEMDAIIGRTYTVPELRETLRRPVPRRRRRPAGVHERPGREPQGRVLGQRVPHPRQPHGRVERRLADPGAARPARRRGRRRQRRDGLGPHGAPARRLRGHDRLPPLAGRAAGPRGRGPPRASRRASSSSSCRPGRGPRRREPLGHRPALHPDGARRARRVRPARARSRSPARSSRSTATSSSSPSAPRPTRCSPGARRSWQSTSGATSSRTSSG